MSTANGKTVWNGSFKFEDVNWYDVKCWMRVCDNLIELREFGTDKAIPFNLNELTKSLESNEVKKFVPYKKDL